MNVTKKSHRIWRGTVISALLALLTVVAGCSTDNGATGGALSRGNSPKEVVQTVSEAWVQFAKTGRPSAEGLPEWPEYTKDNRASMHLNNVSSVSPFMDASMVELFHNMLWAMNGLGE